MPRAVSELAWLPSGLCQYNRPAPHPGLTQSKPFQPVPLASYGETGEDIAVNIHQQLTCVQMWCFHVALDACLPADQVFNCNNFHISRASVIDLVALSLGPS